MTFSFAFSSFVYVNQYEQKKEKSSMESSVKILNKTKIIGILIIGLVLAMSLNGCDGETVVVSPDGSVKVAFRLKSGVPYYAVFKDGIGLLSDSKMGFKLKGQPSLEGDFEVVSVEETSFDETWTQPWGEVKNIREHYNGIIITLKEKSQHARSLQITFRVFDDGLGFRYSFPEQDNLDEFQIEEELTEFNMTKDFSAWWIPAYGPAIDHEYLFRQNKLTELTESVHTPLTMESGDSLFVTIHEAALVDYAGMTLKPEGTSLRADLVPWSTGVKVIGKTPLNTPWRTIQIGKSAADLITSYLILNLNEPNKLTDISWIKPGKYSGIWWGMHVGTQTWSMGPRHGATTENVRKLIEFSAKSNLSGVLVEGWNVGWDTNGLLDFTKPYPDFDIDFLSDYARKNNIALIGHHETYGNIANYENQLPAAFEYYRRLGIHTVKTGYVANNPNGNEWHQGQYMVRHYHKVMELAAQFQLMVDMHEPVKATGLRRTYPNMMTREGARGTEYEAWSEGNPPEHTVILPFTRCLAGPLDYTPGIFDILIKTKPENRVHTTLAKQLALYVTIYSPLQMVADLPENYEGNPAFKFIRDVPTDWEETKVINARIGDYLTIVRKDRNSDDWYLGSTTDESSRSFRVSLDFLVPGKKYMAETYSDGPDADVDTNPLPVTIGHQMVTSEMSLELRLARGGGQAIRFHLME